MSALYHRKNTFVSMEFVEHDGVRYDPKTLIAVNLEKDPRLIKYIAVGVIIVLVGLWALFSGSTTFALICLLGGGGWAGWNYFLYQSKSWDNTWVTASFSGGRHTGKPDVFVEYLGYEDANNLKEALLVAKQS